MDEPREAPPAGDAVTGAPSRLRERLLEDALPIAVILALLVYDNGVLRSHFFGSVYGFHDLGLITDWFTNALWYGRPFWITDMAVNHLSIHFTPTILLLTPLYLLSSSAYVLVLAGTVSAAAGLYLAHRVFMAQTSGAPLWTRVALTLAMILLVATSPYWQSVLDSAHIEVHYIPLALGFFLSLLWSERRLLPIVLFFLALGVREEAGLYMAAQCVALAAVTPTLRLRRTRVRRLLLVCALFALVYVVLVVKVINPLAFGVHENHIASGWSGWGQSWGDVVWNALVSPRRLGAAVGASAFFPLQRSLGFLPWLNPLVGAIVNAPGVLLYTGTLPHRVRLWFYNSAFLWPGLMLACGIPLAWALRRVARRFPSAFLPPALLVSVTVALVAVTALGQFRATADNRAGFIMSREPPRVRQDAREIAAWLSDKDAIPTVATDFLHIVHVPNRSRRYMLDQYAKADVVFIFRGATPFWSGVETSQEVWGLLEKDARFVLSRETPVCRIYERRENH
jgi:hypothetical protein